MDILITRVRWRGLDRWAEIEGTLLNADANGDGHIDYKGEIEGVK